MPKLDLMNHRFFYKNENYRIHDSCEDLNLSTLSTSNGKTGLRFSRQLGREIYKSQEIYHSNELVDPPPKNHRGDYVSCLESSIHSPLKNIISEKLTNSFELFNNDAALIYHTATRLNKSTKEAPGSSFRR